MLEYKIKLSLKIYKRKSKYLYLKMHTDIYA